MTKVAHLRVEPDILQGFFKFDSESSLVHFFQWTCEQIKTVARVKDTHTRNNSSWAHQPVSFSEILLSSGERFHGGAFMNVTPEEAKGLREILGTGNSDSIEIPCSELERLQPGLDQLLGPGAAARLCRGPVRVRVFAQLAELHALGIARFS